MRGPVVLAYIAVGTRNAAAIDSVNALADRFNACPELLEALTSLLAHTDSWRVIETADGDIARARAALAKARGAA